MYIFAPMSKKDQNAIPDEDIDIRYFLHQPHDKYVRALLQHRVSALQIIDFALDESLRSWLDLESLQLTNNTFIDEKLQISLADICYQGRTKTQKPFRICLLFEHKSEMPARGLYEQLNRYINNVWLEDQRQERPPTLSIPILIYHGTVPIAKESPAKLFPDAPVDLLRFVPQFDYVLLDLAALSTKEIEHLGRSMLRNIFLALKFSRNEAYLNENWKKILIFAPIYHQDFNLQVIIKLTLLYMVSVSKTVQNKLENPATVMTVEEEEMVLPYVFEKYRLKYKEEGLEEGKKKGMKEGKEEGLKEGLKEGMVKIIMKFIERNPEMPDTDIAAYFEVEPELVLTARAKT